MDAVTTVPSPTNEPPLHFPPGSSERARLEMFEHANWGCTLADGPWQALQFGSSKLEYLAWRHGFFYDAHQALADQAHTEIAKAPQDAEQIAQKLGLNFDKADKFKSGDPLPFIGADKQASETVASLKKGEVSPVIQAGNRLAIAVVDSVTPPHPAEFADVVSAPCGKAAVVPMGTPLPFIHCVTKSRSAGRTVNRPTRWVRATSQACATCSSERFGATAA